MGGPRREGGSGAGVARKGCLSRNLVLGALWQEAEANFI